jgi:hypothetical protein
MSKKNRKKLSIDELEKVSPAKLLKLIQLGKSYIKGTDVVKKMFKDYDMPLSFIDLIPVSFAKLDVSAKTLKGVVFLNFSLLADGDFFKDLGYLVHEFSHVLQQITGDSPTKGSEGDSESYLSNKDEIEAFSNQVEFLAEEFDYETAEDYVDRLLDYHEMRGLEKKKHKNDLMENIDQESAK